MSTSRTILAMLIALVPSGAVTASDSLSLAATEGRVQVVGSLGAWTAETQLEGCVPAGVRELKHTAAPPAVALVHSAQGPVGQRCRVSETFAPIAGGVHWEIQVVAEGAFWTTPIVARVKAPVTGQMRFWTAWMRDGQAWEDPLLARPMIKNIWPYGPYFSSGIAIPIASLLDEKQDAGVSCVVSPENTLLDMTLSTTAAGEMEFRFAHHRLGQGQVVRLSLDLVRHEADWRGGLRWMVARYPAFFDPPNPKAHAIGGCASYSGWYKDVDYARLKRMAFTYRWEAAFDWPCHGMFLPPVGDNETWMSAGCGEKANGGRPHQASFALMNGRAREMHAHGTWHLSYFQTSEFGTQVKSIDGPRLDLPAKDLWKDQIGFLRERIADGIWLDRQGKESYEGWYRAVIMDPAGPQFRAFLLEQARRYVEEIPDSDGVCVDRMSWSSKEPGDWVKPINWGADDGLGWYEGRAGRHFSVSWKSILAGLDPIMHQAGKVIFVNPIMGYRLDFMRHVDGIYDEVWRAGPAAALNGTGLLAIRKPATIWTVDATWLKPDPDAYFQRHLHMGAYPTAPFPMNDHTIRPDSWADRQYLDYGPLLDAIRGKKWVLQPHCIEVAGSAAKANLFEVPGGWVAPVTFGPKEGTVHLVVRHLPGLAKGVSCEVLHPGDDQAQPIPAASKEGTLELQVPLKRGCAVVRIAVARPSAT